MRTSRGLHTEPRIWSSDSPPDAGEPQVETRLLYRERGTVGPIAAKVSTIAYVTLVCPRAPMAPAGPTCTSAEGPVQGAEQSTGVLGDLRAALLCGTVRV